LKDVLDPSFQLDSHLRSILGNGVLTIFQSHFFPFAKRVAEFDSPSLPPPPPPPPQPGLFSSSPRPHLLRGSESTPELSRPYLGRKLALSPPEWLNRSLILISFSHRFQILCHPRAVPTSLHSFMKYGPLLRAPFCHSLPTPPHSVVPLLNQDTHPLSDSPRRPPSIQLWFLVFGIVYPPFSFFYISYYSVS